MKRNYFRVAILLTAIVTGVTILGALALAGSYVYLSPSLPTTEAMRNVEFAVPLRVYTRDGRLIAQIGEQRRIPVDYQDIPELVKQAFLAAEDDRFFRHSGIDYSGVVRAALVNLFSGNRAQGASTITMQAARNMFLTQKREWRRKLQEVFLTWRMEREFTKEQILALYLNVIFFGQRAYGVAAAAETYFGKPLADLSVSEAALLAGIPKAPTQYNPVANPERAAERRGYVLRRMREVGYIDEAAAEAAQAVPVPRRVSTPSFEVDAPYVAEMARLEVVKRYGEESQSRGYKVYTTIDAGKQAAANGAVRRGLLEYDRRRGWRGAEARIELPAAGDADTLDAALGKFGAVGGMQPAVVTAVTDREVTVHVKGQGAKTIAWEGLSWARREIDESRTGPAPKTAGEVVAPGDVVRVATDAKGNALLAQVPAAQAALVALDPHDGAIVALVGGFDYYENKYNRVTQARRQPGSGFKPFIYSAALDNGFTPASVILDAPIVIDDPSAELEWRPENATGEFGGPTRFRDALVRSRNLVSIRVLRELGVGTAIDHAARFGFDKASMPRDLTLALGTLDATPLDVATGFAVFANGGYKVDPYFIDRIDGPDGQAVWRATPTEVPGGDGLPVNPAPRVISEQNVWIMDDILSDVIRRGTGRRALALGRSDIGGKTGTTNESKDAWFNGFNQDLVATVWVGYDEATPLGEGEEGSRTAVPIWTAFMQEALKGVPQRSRPMPAGIIQVAISMDTGALTTADDPFAITEYFMADRPPGGDGIAVAEGGAPVLPADTTPTDPLF